MILYIQMAKKYLLYIHDELFEKEPSKSKLVNSLLERHYHTTMDGGKNRAEVLNDIAVKMAAVKEFARQQNDVRFTGKIKMCTVHNIPVDKYDRCLQKGCKYS